MGIKNQFKQLLLDPSFQLSPELSDLCEEISANCFFCDSGNCRLSVAKTIISNSIILSWDIKRDNKRN